MTRDAFNQRPRACGSVRQSKSRRVARARGRYANGPTTNKQARSVTPNGKRCIRQKSNEKVKCANTRVTANMSGAVRETKYLAPKLSSAHSDAKRLMSRAKKANPLSARCADEGHDRGATARIDTICSA
eukprot:Amastigsp_a347805_6.p2 type:complete len:129 gc:universal Amastigsp_a347805_6:1214-828(-)